MKILFKKRVIKNLLPTFFFLIILINSITITTTATFGDIYLDNSWEYVDDEYDGASNVTSGVITTDWTYYASGHEFQVTNNYAHTGSQSFWIDADVAPTDLGYWNLTTDYSYIGVLDFWFQREAYNTYPSDGWLKMDFYNYTDDRILGLSFNRTTLQARDVDNDYNNIYGASLVNNQWYNLVITHVNGNTMNYSLYYNNNLIGYNQDSTMVSTDWVNFSYIKFRSVTSGPNGNDFWFDDLTINEQSPISYVGDNYVTQVTCPNLCNDVIIGSTHQYEIEVIGIGEPKAILRISNTSGRTVTQKILNEGINTVNVYYPYEYQTGEWLIEVFNYYSYLNPNLTAYYENCTINVVQDEYITNLSLIYGDFFVEWYQDGYPCYYSVQDNPTPSIVYQINDSFLVNKNSCYILDVILGRNGNTVYSTYLCNLTFDITMLKRLGGFEFTTHDNYMLVLYNTTVGNNELLKDEIVYISQPIEVCGTESDYIDDDHGTETEETEDEDNIFLGVELEIWYTIFGIGICLLFFFIPTLVSQNFRHPVPKEINIASGAMAIISCSLFGLFPLWVLFVFCLLLVLFIIAKVREIIK